MTDLLGASLDAFGHWRRERGLQLEALERALAARELLEPGIAALLHSMRARLAGDKLMLAFVGEFSRGKSELINAIFFAAAGRRVLPATPGRTTMCPVELGYDRSESPALALLPIETRLDGRTLAELRATPAAWTLVPLDPQAPQQLADALAAVTETRHAGLDEARALGLWDDAAGADNPPLVAGGVEVPKWRHALVNFPHPLLERGLVVLDTPGLNAVGAEPELTLGLLPSAHATVFLLAADAGVTRSDLALWRDHLDAPIAARFVALNKIDALADPLSTPEHWRAQIERQRTQVSRLLSVEPARVFALSARQALAARVAGDDAALAQSHVPALEAALAEELLEQRRGLMERWLAAAARQLEARLSRQLADRRRLLAEQALELRGLRGKSSAKLRAMLERVDADAADFERCTARLQAMRSVHGRLVRQAQQALAAERVKAVVEALPSTLLGIGARSAFARTCGELRAALDAAEAHGVEIHAMLGASFALLNADFGFALQLAPRAEFAAMRKQLDAIERNYSRLLGLREWPRASRPGFIEQFRRMLLGRALPVFEAAEDEIAQWSRSAEAAVESQLRERRRAFKRRREALERISGAAGELEQRLAEFDHEEARFAALQAELARALAALAEPAGEEPAAEQAADPAAMPAARLRA